MNIILKRISDYIVHVADPDTIILFGSYAKGSNNLYSDIDLLLISEHTYQNRVILKQIQRFIHELSLKSDILIRKKSEVEMASLDPYSFLGSILKEGQVIYQKNTANV